MKQETIATTFSTAEKIILINEVSFIGDSIIFFWPLVNAFTEQFQEKEIIVYHTHKSIFKPISLAVVNEDLSLFYEDYTEKYKALIFAFYKSDGNLKNYLKSNKIPSLVKGMVGMDFTTLNLPGLFFERKHYDNEYLDNIEIKYSFKNKEVDSSSGFPLLGEKFTNVYEYSNVCNETFFGFKNMSGAVEQNIIMSALSNLDMTNLFLSRFPSENRNFILINLICGTFKKDVEENFFSLVQWIQKTADDCRKENLDIYLLSDNKFPHLKSDIETSSDNLFFVKEESVPLWTRLMKEAIKVYSIDTGFLHIAHVLNKNTFGFGGDVDFWFFKDKRIDFNEY